MDVLEVNYNKEFDVVLNMADGAIGYFDTEEQNNKLFDIISKALKKNGKHVMGIPSADYAVRHFPKRNWEVGENAIDLSDFIWFPKFKRYLYRSHVIKFGEILPRIPNEFSDVDKSDHTIGIRLYTLDEIKEIYKERGMKMVGAFGNYDISTNASCDIFQSAISGQKI